MKIIAILFLIISGGVAQAADFNASLFGCRSDGTTNNTSSIQYAIDHISEQGGGTLHFYVGRYLTGSIELKSNVSIQLHEGAVLVASPHVYDYLDYEGTKALIYAKDQSDIRITGKGVIQGQVPALQNNVGRLRSSGIIPDDAGDPYPALIHIEACERVAVEGITFIDGFKNVQAYKDCASLVLAGQAIHSRRFENSSGIVMEGCTHVELRSLYIDSSGPAFTGHLGTSNDIQVKTDCVTATGESI